MADKFPESYADPLYDQVDAANEVKLGIPVGLLSSIRTAGEKTDASRVSSAGATTPYQFIPATRRAILDKYGIDVTLSPENASEGAGLLLQESLKRSKGDVETAVRQYHGGTDPKNWGKVNDAYAGRVLGAQTVIKRQALSDDFAKFMAANPAVPSGSSAPAAPAGNARQQALADDVGQWLAEKNKPAVTSADIPQTMRPDGTMPPPVEVPAPQADPTLVDKLIGGGETALTLATGMTTGAVGMLAGGVAGAVGNLTNGRFGMKDGVEAGMQQGAESLTYAPRTEVGQEYAGAVGKGLAAALPAFPLTAELGAAGRAVGAASAVARDLSAAGVQRIRTAAPAIAERVERTLRRNPDQATPTPGTRGSAGSAGVDMATQRHQLAADLPVPIKLTRGQATRDFEQQSFEKETAKNGAHGEPLRERQAQQNEDVMKNFDAWVDQAGTTTADAIEAGKVVDQVLRKELARDKAEVRVRYAAADKSAEAQAPVVLDDAVQFLNDSAPDQAVSPLLVAARAHAIKLGIAAEGDGGALMAIPTTVKNAERFRRAVGAATDYEPTNIRNSAIIKGSVDTATESIAGPLYRDARRARENLGNKWENRGVISDLMNNKRGMNDRKVAVEDVFQHIILNSDRAEVGHLRRVLHAGGDDGHQAWRELQGQTVQWIKDQATKNVATDERGNRIVSAAQLEKAIVKLDSKGKLDFIFGKQGAQQMRDMNDLVKVIYTAPPGAVNFSNTASALGRLIATGGSEAALMQLLTGLPVPVLTMLKIGAGHVKNVRLQKRIQHALNTGDAPRASPRLPGQTLH